MKIIQIMPEFGLAGAETMCENLTYELCKLGHSVIIISMYDYHSAITDRMEKAGIDIRYLDKKSGLDFSMIGKMKKIFRTEKPDVIHTHRYVMQYAIPAAIMAGVKRKVHTLHSVAQKENSRLARKFNRIFFKCCGVIPVALSDLVRDTITKEYGIDKNRIPVILNGVDLSKCQPKTTYDINGKFKILHIGRFSEPKNHLCLLEAFKIFHEKYPESELHLIGDGEKRAEIESFIRENNLSDNVKLLGLQSCVHGFLHDADIFTLPSIYEGIPMTLAEAMGTGLPIVASCVGGIPDMISDHKNGLLCEPSVQDIADKFEIFICDKELREKYGKAAKELSHRFSALTMGEKYCELYGEIRKKH